MAGRPVYNVGPFPGGSYPSLYMKQWMGQPHCTHMGPPKVIRSAHHVWKRRGLGQGNCMSPADISAAVGSPANCDPRDASCVMCNSQMANAVSNLVDSGCIAPGTPISFSCDTSQNALNAFQSNAPLAVNATVGTGASAFVATGPTSGVLPGMAPGGYLVTSGPAVLAAGGSFFSPTPVTGGTLEVPTSGNTSSAQAGTAVAVVQPTVTNLPAMQPPGTPPPQPTSIPGMVMLTPTTTGLTQTTTTTSSDLIPGVDNSILLIAGAAGLVLIVALAGKK